MTLFTTPKRDNRARLRVNRSPPGSRGPLARFKRRRAPQAKIRRFAVRRPPALNRALFAANKAAALAAARRTIGLETTVEVNDTDEMIQEFFD